MVCQRCRGLLVRETFGDLNAETDDLYAATRCLNCGCIQDAVIRANRSRRQERSRTTPRGMVRKGHVVFCTIDPQEPALIR
jgi:hypothetical protein